MKTKLYSVAILAKDKKGEFIVAMSTLGTSRKDALKRCYDGLAAEGAFPADKKNPLNSVSEVPRAMINEVR